MIRDGCVAPPIGGNSPTGVEASTIGNVDGVHPSKRRTGQPQPRRTANHEKYQIYQIKQSLHDKPMELVSGVVGKALTPAGGTVTKTADGFTIIKDPQRAKTRKGIPWIEMTKVYACRLCSLTFTTLLKTCSHLLDEHWEYASRLGEFLDNHKVLDSRNKETLLDLVSQSQRKALQEACIRELISQAGATPKISSNWGLKGSMLGATPYPAERHRSAQTMIEDMFRNADDQGSKHDRHRSSKKTEQEFSKVSCDQTSANQSAPTHVLQRSAPIGEVRLTASANSDERASEHDGHRSSKKTEQVVSKDSCQQTPVNQSAINSVSQRSADSAPSEEVRLTTSASSDDRSSKHDGHGPFERNERVVSKDLCDQTLAKQSVPNSVSQRSADSAPIGEVRLTTNTISESYSDRVRVPDNREPKRGVTSSIELAKLGSGNIPDGSANIAAVIKDTLNRKEIKHEQFLLQSGGELVPLLTQHYVRITTDCPKCKLSVPMMRFTALHSCIRTTKNALCEVCGNLFSFVTFRSHHRQCHGVAAAPRTLECEYCGKEVSKPRMSRHVQQVHLETARLSCVICNATFAAPASLRRHERIHRRLTPYKCEHCNRSFSQQANLKAHMRQHTGEKPFQCEHCKKSFTHKVSLKTHLKKHHGVDLWKEGRTEGGRPKRKNAPAE